jgi:tRNA threonylcarbamoyladenosine biosynthesis protein TsaB
MSDGAVLAIDTAFGSINVALCSHSGELIASDSASDTPGLQAEKLPPLVHQMFAKANVSPHMLARIVVTVGPGAFTGVRVGLAFAKGLAVALRIPLLGYTTLSCLAEQARVARPGAAGYACVIDARRSEFYAQGFDGDLNALFGPGVMGGDEIVHKVRALGNGVVVAGSGAGIIVDRLRETGACAEALEMKTIDAGLLALRARAADPVTRPPVPCYLRAADARLPS